VFLATAPTPDPFAFPAFVISIIAAIAGIGALGWNVWTWWQGGARVTLETLAVHSEATQWINVVIRNKGRSAVTVTEVLLYTEGTPTSESGLQTLLGQNEGEQIMPYRLESQASLEFYEQYDADDNDAYGKPGYWVTVELANGKMIDSGWIKNH
jgi:hypothetical protein